MKTKISLSQEEIALLMECLNIEGENTMSVIDNLEARHPTSQFVLDSLTESYRAIDALYTKLKKHVRRSKAERITTDSKTKLLG